MKFTINNYKNEFPKLKNVSEQLQKSYDFTCEAQKYYGKDTEITETIDLFLQVLNKKYGSTSKSKPAKTTTPKAVKEKRVSAPKAAKPKAEKPKSRKKKTTPRKLNAYCPKWDLSNGFARWTVKTLAYRANLLCAY
ncbi:MAG: hypothetical protein LBU90_07590 [Bacteroidales bacterium]|jgi:hypothetical protein|nr:hypothetical protein [Bacteroidales bacterium]